MLLPLVIENQVLPSFLISGVMEMAAPDPPMQRIAAGAGKVRSGQIQVGSGQLREWADRIASGDGHGRCRLGAVGPRRNSRGLARADLGWRKIPDHCQIRHL